MPNAVGEILAASIDFEFALQKALQRATPGFADWCAIDYYRSDGDLQTIHSGYPDARQEHLILEIRRRYRVERGENGDVLAALRSGEALLYPDMAQIASVRLSPDEQELLGELDLRSSIVVPVHVDGSPLGVVSFVSKHRRYEDADLESAREFAAGCSRLLEQAREKSEAGRATTFLERFHEQAPVGLAFLDDELRFRLVNVRLAEMHGIPVEAHIGRTLAEVLGDLAERLAPLYERALQQQTTLDHELEVGSRIGPVASRHWHVCCAPLEVDGSARGLSVVVHDITERKRAETWVSFLSRAAEILESSLDYRRTLQSVAQLAVPDIADWCSISMLNERGEMYRLAVSHHDPVKDKLAQELIEREALPLSAPAGAATAMQSAETQLVEDFTDDLLVRSLEDTRSQEIVRTLGIGSAISVPLIARGRTLGAISLISERPGRFDGDDVGLAEELASRAAVSIDNARLYTEHTRIARTLQAGLKPQSLPRIPGLELATRYRPAGELIEVGGDFYDAYLRPTGEWLVAIGDVTGKGAEAAATTALVRYTLRAAAQQPGSPGELLRALNTAMLDQGADFCTIGLVGIRPLESAPHELTICLAGHPLPILLAGGSAVPVGVPGTLLGYVPDAHFTETRVTLPDEEILLLYTDGLTDATAPGWTQEELYERVSDCPTDQLDGLLARLEDQAIEAGEGHPRDDIAMLAIRRSG